MPVSLRPLVLAAAWIFPFPLGATPTAVPTFESMGLYWDVNDGSATRDCDVRFREVGTSTWNDAQPLWFDDQQMQYRGSVVMLAAGSEYEFELALENGATETITASTWSNTFPIGTTQTLPATSSGTLRITTGGTPQGYALYTAPAGGAAIDVNNAEDTCVSVEADYVILRGVTCRGAAIDGIRIGNQKNVVIEDCEVTNWGRPDPSAGTNFTVDGNTYAIPPNLGYYLDAGIHVDGPDSEQIILQGNKVHHARYTANNWTQVSPYFSRFGYKSTHPQGPTAIVFAEVTKGRHVIRWNEIGNDAQDLDHMFYDAMLAAEPQGNGLVGDSDIYGNRISDCWDDGIEAERGERNVRIWGNHFARMIKCVSVGYVWEGPLYVWGNVAEDLLHPNEMAAPHNGGESPFVAHPPCFIPPPQEDPGENRNGIVYVYHNTLLTGSGAGAGWAFNTWKAHTYSSSTGTRLVSRNNIWQTVSYPGYFLEADSSGTNYFVQDFYASYFSQDYDLHSGIITPAATAGANTTQGEPSFLPGHGAGSAGLYQLASSTPGQGDGMLIANFNDGSAPDRGAHQSGTSAMVFGTANWSVDDEPGIQAITLTATSSADAHVNSQSPSSNYGSNIELNVQKSSGRNFESYLRFDLSGINGVVSSAKLRLKESTMGTSANNNGSISVRSVTGSWEENTITWNNKPAYGATYLGTVPANTIANDEVIDIALDASHFVNPGTYDLALIGTSDAEDTPFISQDAGGNAPQLILTITPQPDGAPAAPTDLHATVTSSTEMDLSWSDNSSNETVFTIERKTGAGGTYATLTSIAANATSFSDNGLTEGVTYFYRVMANNAEGDSGYSNEVNVTAGEPTVLNVFLIGGQSNANGYGDPADLPASLQAPQNDVLLYNGSPGPDNTIPDNAGLNPLRPRTDGFGPAVTFGRSMADYHTSPNQSVALIQYAKDGSTLITDWVAGGTAGTTGDGAHYQSFQSTVTAGMAALAQANPTKEIVLRGMIWMQGESDGFQTGSSNAYQANLTAFIADFRLTYGASVPFVVGRLSTSQTMINSSNLAVVRNAQETVVAATSDAGIVDTDTLTVFDTVHFDGDSQEALGYGFATSMQGVLSNPLAGSAPSDFTATVVSPSRIDLTWTDNAVGETGFIIDRKESNGGTWAQIATPAANATSYSDNTLTAATAYTFRVRATSTEGDSPFAEISATTGQVPNPDGSFTFATIADTGVASDNIGWNNGTGVDMGVQESSGSGRDMHAYLRFTVSGLAGPVTSAKLQLKESPEGTSGNTNSAMSVRAITGAWTETGVTWGTKPAYSSTSLGSVPANSIGQDDLVEIPLDLTAFSGDGTYDFAVIGTTDGNDVPFMTREATGDFAPKLVLTVDSGASVPAAPSALAATSISASQVDLGWSDNSSNETGFTIERKTGAGGTYATLTNPAANATAFSDTGLTAGTTYYYRVLANGSAGDSSFSNEANATPQDPTEQAVSFNAVADARVESTNANYAYGTNVAVGVQQSDGSGRIMDSYLRFNVTGLQGTVTAAKLRLTESDTGTSSNNNSAMSVREITGSWAESTVTFNTRPSYAGTSLGTVPANSIGQDDVVEIDLDPTGFSADGTYNLAVIGTSVGGDVPFNSREAGTGAPELVLTVSVVPRVPDAPSNLSASAVSESRINLSWSDNSINETGFTIERKDGAGGSFASIATVATNTTDFSDTGRSLNVAYYYRVRADGTVGNSGYSNEADATPLPTAATNLRFPAVADTFVSELTPTTNYGADNRLSLYNASGEKRRAYVRFQVSGLAGVPVQSVALDFVEKMDSNDAGVAFEVRKVTAGSWTEAGLNWNNQPTLGSTSFGTFTPVIAPFFTVPSNGKEMAAPDTRNGMGVRVNLDPSFITGDGVYEIALIPVSGLPGWGADMDLYSREEIWSTQDTLAAGPRLVINPTSDFNGDSDPKVIGAAISEYVLRKGIEGRYYDDPFYSNVLSYFGILTFAAPDVADIPSLVSRAITDYNPYLGNQTIYNNYKDNVDSCVLGIVPFEIYRQKSTLQGLSGWDAYKTEGIKYADTAFTSTLPGGVSRLTRWWVDDMFMLGAMQSSAYENTQVATYANNAATQMVIEGQRCQQPNGLGWHRNDSEGNGNGSSTYTGVPVSEVFWGRGNGWMASGMTRTLMALPVDHPQRAALLIVYQNQMAGLKAVQDVNGMWHQVLDDPTSYEETSSTALFMYSMANGIINGWLDAAVYQPVVDKAWDAVTRHIQSHGRVTDVCWGGPSRADTESDYYVWPKADGDNHGEGALLISIEAMMRLEAFNEANSGGFDTWADSNGISGEAWDDDFDHDGLSNGLEYALAGLDPTVPDSLSPLGADGVLTFNKRAEAVANGDVTYLIETSPDLSPPWTAVTPDLNNDSVISYTLPAGEDRVFARLSVVK